MFNEDLIKFYTIFRVKALSKEELTKLFVKLMVKHETVYHWDEHANEIINGRTGDVLFTADQCEILDKIVEELYSDTLFDLANASY